MNDSGDHHPRARSLVMSAREVLGIRRRADFGPRAHNLIDLYSAYRGQIEHEDDLIGARLGWLIATEAFLFVAYATALTVNANHAPHGFNPGARHLFEILPPLGIVLGVVVGTAAAAAASAVKRLVDDYECVCKCLRTPTGEDLRLPRIGSVGRIYASGVAPVLFVPFAFVASWVLILVL